ncbi:hypothetical protein QFC19_001188 [Naganishia cerealis]|uniref:Uncharacterized protein n=1 Tax=Naganishia cerealis TaxID=610337 RepID=A0ACC2WJS7_9TREE|nr:hypothetical protein QFC19_001188 [Naganishia cerealis]
MSTSLAGGSYKPLTGPYSPASTDLVLSLLPESSSLPSTSPPEVHVTTYLRAALRAAQTNLNEECAKTADVKLGLEKTDLEYSRLQLERRSLKGAVAALQVDDNKFSSPDLPHTDEFLAYCNNRAEPLPTTEDVYYGQAVAKARYEWELEQIAEREELATALQTRLELVRKDATTLKRKAILADSTLDELQELMVKAKQALAEVVLPVEVGTSDDEDVEMESTPDVTAPSSPLTEIDKM